MFKVFLYIVEMLPVYPFKVFHFFSYFLSPGLLAFLFPHVLNSYIWDDESYIQLSTNSYKLFKKCGAERMDNDFYLSEEREEQHAQTENAILPISYYKHYAQPELHTTAWWKKLQRNQELGAMQCLRTQKMNKILC